MEIKVKKERKKKNKQHKWYKKILTSSVEQTRMKTKAVKIQIDKT